MEDNRRDWSHWDALDALSSPKPPVGCESRNRSDSGWAGSTPEEAVTLLENGWEEPIGTLRIEPTVRIEEIPRPVIQWDLSGGEVDIGAYLSGIPEHMGDYSEFPTPRRMIRVGIDLAVNCTVTAEQMLKVGRSTLTVVESLRMLGYPVEIWGCWGISDTHAAARGDVYDARVLVQSANAPVHAARVAFWVAHPSALRRAMFALVETLPSRKRAQFGFASPGFGMGSGYGVPKPGFAKDEFDEWTPSAQLPEEQILSWAKSVLARRVAR